MKSLPFIFAVVLLSITSITAQDTKTYVEKETTLFIGPCFSNIKSNNLLNDQYASSKGSNWFNLGFDYCKYANKNLGFILGLEYSRYKNVTAYKGAYRSEVPSLDVFGNYYYPVREANYTETRSVHAIDMPIGLRLSFPSSSYSVFFVDFGLRGNFIASAKIYQYGNLNRKAAYPHPVYDNAFLYVEDDPYYGYTNTEYRGAEIDIPVNRFNVSYFVGMGIKTRVSENCTISVNPVYTNGINDVYRKDAAKDYENIFGDKSAHQKFTLTQFVLRIGLGFEM